VCVSLQFTYDEMNHKMNQNAANAIGMSSNFTSYDLIFIESYDEAKRV